METSCVEIHVIVLNVGKAFCHVRTATEEETVRSPHDVGLVDGSDCLPPSGAGVLKSKLSHSH